MGGALHMSNCGGEHAAGWMAGGNRSSSGMITSVYIDSSYSLGYMFLTRLVAFKEAVVHGSSSENSPVHCRGHVPLWLPAARYFKHEHSLDSRSTLNEYFT